ncbi:MAG TPA: hypothetical protein PLY96_10350 [Chromatiaceae bacterium]|jgi:methyl-accepting chemotaxis protein|nr:hypothetical protein [Chromatiaceae bacterium]
MPEAPADQTRIDEIASGFHHLLDQQFAMHLRVARRTTALVRYGMVSLAVVGIIMLLLLLTLSWRIKPMVAAVGRINHNFSAIAADMTVMKTAVLEMQTQITEMPVMATEMDRMRGNVRDISINMDLLSRRMSNLDTNMASITEGVTRMAGSFGAMNETVGVMGGDVHTLSGPMRVFNWMTPFK